MTRYIGIDLSLSSTGVCVLDEDGRLVASEAIKTKPSGQSIVDRFLRYREIWVRIYDWACSRDFFHVAIEGYSYGNHIKGLGPLIECGGYIRGKLLNQCSLLVEIVEIPPSCVKKWATGNGNANKTHVMAAIKSRYGVQFGTDDEADAFCLAKILWQMQDVERCETFKEECVVRQILSKGEA